ncbi:MAG TPA: carbohydrate kinase family protein [Candidatus Paceibacterota bacterium]
MTDILAIGDVVIDNFIRLKEAEVVGEVDHQKLCMRFADKIPFDYSVEVPAVGNAANAAVAAAKLGLTSSFHSYVGNDEHGARCIKALQDAGVDTSLVEAQDGKHTNYHFVLWYDDERTILIKHEAFQYAPPALAQSPKWIYLSSLAEHSLPYHEQLAELLAQHPETKLAFQPGTFQIKFGTEALRNIYARTNIFFCNKEEAQIITRSQSEDIRELLHSVQALGPKIAVITDGHLGAYVRNEDGSMWNVPMYPDPKPPFERTGAGDAFSSTVVSALALDLPLEQALLWGPINAMGVVQEVGAQKGLFTRMQLEKHLTQAPATYRITPLA